MRWYAETSGRRAAQLVGEALVGLWALAWWAVATTTRDLVAALGAPGRGLASTSDRLGGALSGVADALAGAPLVGDALGAPFVEAADAAAAVGAAGRAQEAAALDLGTWLGVLLFLVPVGLVAALWLAVRVRGARERAAAARLRDEGGTELLALRALVRQRVPALYAASASPVADWRSGDHDRLAALELARCGLRGPA